MSREHERPAAFNLAPANDSHVEWFEGNFQDYEEDKKRRLGEGTVNSHLIKHKKFER